ncbi:MAG: hypothetical protein AAGI70_03050 [Pseudomonadota bacterium]
MITILSALVLTACAGAPTSGDAQSGFSDGKKGFGAGLSSSEAAGR